MLHFNTVQFAVLVVAVLALFWVISTIVRKAATFSGYQEFQEDVLTIRAALKGEVFRDGDDLVVTGNFGRYPAQMRLSYAENTPGLSLRMHAPVAFKFSAVPKGARATEGRVLVRSGSELLDARFSCRTDHPTQSKMVLGSRAALASLEKLCCSARTFVTLNRGSVELNELTIPDPYLAKHVLDHLKGMEVLGKVSSKIPGSEAIKIERYRARKSHPVMRGAIAAGALVTLMAVVGSARKTESAAPMIAPSQDFGGVLPSDAAEIPRVFSWRVADESDFDQDSLNWLRGNGADPASRFELALQGQGKSQATAYLLKRRDGPGLRVVLLQDHLILLDSEFDDLQAIARVPVFALSSVEWQAPPPALPQADSLLLLRKRGDQRDAYVVYLHDGKLTSAKLTDFRRLSFR